MFLKAFPMMIGTVASIGYPAESDKAAMLRAPFWNFYNKASGAMLKTASGMMLPSS